MTREMLEFVVPWLVDNQDEVEIAELEGDGGETIFELTVHPDDIGKIIGKNGRIIRSLRMLARAAGGSEGPPVMVEVVD